MATTLRDNVTAATRADVDAQDTRTRLWESLSNSYDQQAKQIQQAYDRSYSQTGNQLLNRGMGRSSYGSQVLANVNQEGINAQIQNHNNLIADYQNRLQDIEQQEIAQDQWERSFGLQQQQFDWEKQSSQQQIAMSYISAIAAQGGNPSDELLSQAGLTRQDYNAMKTQIATGAVGGAVSGGGRSGSSRTSGGPGPGTTLAWQTAGFGSEAEYNDAMKLGLKTKAEYDAYMALLKAGNDSNKKPGETPYNQSTPNITVTKQPVAPSLSNQPSFLEMANYDINRNQGKIKNAL